MQHVCLLKFNFFLNVLSGCFHQDPRGFLEDFVIWSDRFRHSDATVNRKSSRISQFAERCQGERRRLVFKQPLNRKWNPQTIPALFSTLAGKACGSDPLLFHLSCVHEHFWNTFPMQEFIFFPSISYTLLSSPLPSMSVETRVCTLPSQRTGATGILWNGEHNKPL